MAQIYVTWRPNKKNDNRYDHVASYIDWFPDGVTFQELSYSDGGVDDARSYLGIATYPDSYKPKDFSDLKELSHLFVVDFVAIQNLLVLLNGWYPPQGDDDPYFSLDVDGFTIVDNFPYPVLPG